MKSLAKKIVARAVQNDTVWKAFDRSVNRLAKYGQWARESGGTDDLVEKATQTIAPDLVVKHGPFQGMQYTATQWVGGAVFPKLLGCYERELHEVIEACCKTPYTEIVDIGCAEGYYAVGLARRIPTAKVYAYDIQESAQRRCQEMARANGVDQRVITGSGCSSETLL